MASLRGVSPEHGGRRSTTWQAVRNEVLARIRSQEWAPGTLIPTEKQLATDWGCARATVNRALRELADSGIVERRRKVGTRVSAAPSAQASRDISAIRNDIRGLGAEFGYRLIQSERMAAPADVAQQLQVGRGEPVQYVSALFLADHLPYCAHVVWMQPGALADLDSADFAETSAEEWLEHAVRPTAGRIAILAHGVENGVAEALGVRAGTPVLTIERTHWATARPVALSYQCFPPGHRLICES